MKWNGSNVLITGASRGIGRAVAVAASKKGARVGLLARSKEDLNDVLAACGGNGAIAPCDVVERAQVDDAIKALEADLGPTNILVNNAGIGAYGSVAETDPSVGENMMRINYFGTVYATKAVLPGMIDRHSGHIAMVASIAGRIGAPLEAAYSASKFAVVGWSEAMAMELKPKGIGVSIINPGPVETEFFETRGVPYSRKTPKAVSAEAVAALVIRCVERNKLEAFIPSWLSPALVFKVLVPPAYRMGTQRTFRNDLK
jgi:short-subunit dehydrogenase